VTYRIRYWRKLREIARNLRNADDTTTFYKPQVGYGQELDHSSTSEAECQREIRKGKTLMKEEQEHQKILITTRRNTLAESKVLKKHPYLVGKDDLSSTIIREDLIERQIKQMANKDDKKRMLSVLYFDSKCSINAASVVRSSMSRIDITQQDGSTVAETTKEGIERHLLQRNPKLYRSAGLPPFGDT
jgi:hypothetical protein